MHIYSQTVTVDGKDYRVLTMNQLATETNRLPNQIRNIAYQLDRKTKEARLDVVHPFPNSSSKDDSGTGPVFLLYNEKVKEFIKWCKKNPINR